MSLDRDSPVPLWHQIEQAINADICAGNCDPGTQLPTEAALAIRFGVHRHTIRRALAILAGKGVVRVRRGRGTFVDRPLLAYPITERTRFTATLQRQDRVPSHELLSAVDEPATAEVAEALSVEVNASVTTLQTIGLADAVPISVGVTYCPSLRFPGIAALYQELRSMTSVMAKFGLHDYKRASTKITATLPKNEEAMQLRQNSRDPVLAVESIDVDTEGTPISFSRTCFAGDRVQLIVGP